MYFPREEYEERWHRVRTAMQGRGHETLVVWQRSAGGFDRASDVYWLTNYGSLASGQETTKEGLAVGRGFAAVVFHRGRDPELHIAEPVEFIDRSRLACGDIVSHPVIFRAVSGSDSGQWEWKGESPIPGKTFSRYFTIGSYGAPLPP